MAVKGIWAEDLMRMSIIKERRLRSTRLGLGRDIHEDVSGKGSEGSVLG